MMLAELIAESTVEQIVKLSKEVSNLCELLKTITAELKTSRDENIILKQRIETLKSENIGHS